MKLGYNYDANKVSTCCEYCTGVAGNRMKNYVTLHGTVSKLTIHHFFALPLERSLQKSTACSTAVVSPSVSDFLA